MANQKITYTQAEEMRKLYHASRKYTTTTLGEKFGLSQAQTSVIVSSEKNPIVPTEDERKKFGIVWRIPKGYDFVVTFGNQTYYVMPDKTVWHLQRQMFVKYMGDLTPPVILNVRRVKYVVDNTTYYVYETGEIWSCARIKFMRLPETKGAGIYAPGKQRMGRLMLTLFVRPPKEGEIARHRDGDELNNHISNLRWGTRQDNVNDQVVTGSAKRGKRASNARITEPEAQGLLDEWYKTSFDYASKNEYAKAKGAELGITSTSVYNLINGDTWKHLKRQDVEVRVHLRAPKLTDTHIKKILTLWAKHKDKYSDIAFSKRCVSKLNLPTDHRAVLRAIRK
jgi:hypothetical protein